MQKLFLGSLAILVLLMGRSLLGDVLVQDGKTSCVIVVASDAIEPEKTAALELQSYLKAATGAEFAICDPQAAPANARRIWVGASEPVKQLLPNIEWDKLSADTIILQTIKNDLVLAGGRPRGTLYAVYTFLEDVVGVRWWTSSEQFVPKRPTLEIGELKGSYEPPFRYREAYYRDVVWDHGLFAAKLKLNGNNASIPQSHGGNYSILGFCHTFYQLLPPDVYFKQHPEWYSQIGGKRTSERAQLCLTNQEMRKELTRVALEWIKKNPTAGIISVSQNDGGGPCECDQCKALKESEGSESGPMLHFVNSVAADIAKEYPAFLIHTLAYTYTQTPPLHVRAAPNVMVQLCSMGCYFDFPLDQATNRSFGDSLVQWSKLTSNLFVWDYVTNFTNYHIPHPNLHVLAPNIRFFAKNHVVGVFEQGDTGSRCGDFVQLRAWLLAHLLWNPALDEEKLVQEFLQGYYGAAGPQISAYLDLVRDALRGMGYHLGCYNTETGFLTLAQMNQATQLFNEAEKAVEKDSELLTRVRRERLSLEHLWLLRYSWLKRQAETAQSPFMGPADPVAACEQFIKSVRQFNNGPCQYSEGGSPEAYETYLRNLAQSAIQKNVTAKVPAECEQLEASRWIDLQEDQIALLSGDVKEVEDPLASNGKAVNIPGCIFDWFVRAPITGDIARAFPEAHCFISARCESISQNPDDLVLSIGLYDESQQKNIFVKNLYWKQFKADAYQTFDLGTYPMQGNTYFWIVASGKADKIRSVNVDRMFLIRQP